MVVRFGLCEPKSFEHQEEDFEMVFLFVSYSVNLTVKVVKVRKAQNGGPNVLGHVNGCAIGT